MKLKKCRGLMSYMLVFMMLIMTINPVFAVEKTGLTDVEGHWAETEITKAYNEQLVEGYPDDTFQPDKEIIRAEFITLMNRFLYLKEMAENNYLDVKQTDWFSDEAAKAKQIEYIIGDHARPEENCTREEVVKTLAELLSIQGETSTKTFNDLKGLSVESRQSINGLVEKGYITGYPDKTFKPKGTITRAEILKMFNNTLGTIIRDNDALNGINEIQGNLTIVNTGIDLEGKIINGDLYISPGALDKINLKNLKVTGRIIISGGSEDTPIKLDNVKAKEITIRKTIGKANIEIIGKSEIEKITTKTEAKIEAKKGTTIKELDIQGQATGTQMTGEGKITKATINAKDVTIEQKISHVKVTKNAKSAVIDGRTKKYRSSSSSHSSSSSTVALTGVKLNKESTTLTVGNTETLTATVEPNNATNKKVTWASSNTAVVTVTSNGAITAIAPGKTDITVTAEDGNKTAACEVTVNIDMGSGTEADPYKIYKLEDLDNVRNYRNAYYKLMNNLDFNEDSSYRNPGSNKDLWTKGTGWTLIGTFTGTFDGCGKMIKNLLINKPENLYVGLFSESSGTIKNLGLSNVEVTGNMYVGGLVGFNSGTITNSYVTGSVNSNEDTGGGLVGINTGTISNAYATVAVNGKTWLGGLVGANEENGKIKNSYVTGNVIGTGGTLGGLSGNNFKGTIENCIAFNSLIEGSSYIGRVVGYNSSSTLEGNYANSSMTINGSIVTGGTVENINGADMTAADFKDLTSTPLSTWDKTIWEIKEGADRPTLIGVGNDNGKMKDVVAEALAAINAGTEVFEDFAKAGVTGAAEENTDGYDKAIASEKTKKGSDLTLAEVQSEVNNVNEAILVISEMAGKNADSLTVAMLETAGVTDVVSDYLAVYKISVVSGEAEELNDLIEIQALIDVLNAYERVDETFEADITVTSGATITLTVPTGYTAWFAPADTDYGTFTEGSTMTTALADATSIKAPTTPGDYSFYLVDADGLAYEGNFTLTIKDEDIATVALEAINAGTEIFEDFAKAGVTGAAEENTDGYDKAIASEKTKKGSDLTLAEVQSEVNNVNEAILVISEMAGKNADSLTVAMLKIAGVIDVVEEYLNIYKERIVTYSAEELNNLTKIQALIDVLNAYERVDETFSADITVTSGATITLTVPNGYTAWFAPADTDDGTLTEGPTMTTASAGVTSIKAPTTAGDYSFYLVDTDGLAYEGMNTLTVSGEDSVALEFERGDGTAENPYQITKLEHLNNVRKYLGKEHTDKYFRLMNDLDFNVDSDYLNVEANKDSWITGEGWAPLGNRSFDDSDFTGTFNGNGYTISGLYINNTGTTLGLFGYSSGTIENLGLTDVEISGYDTIGGLVGDMGQGTISKCYVTGTVGNSDSANVGGLVGNSDCGTITNSYATVDVSGNYQIGGLVGSHNGNLEGKGTITNSYSTGNVIGIENVGGLVGYSNTGKITNSIAFNIQLSTNPGENNNFHRIAGYCEGYGLDNNYAKLDMKLPFFVTLEKGIYSLDGIDMENYEFMNPENAPLSSWNFTDIWELKDGADRPTLKGVGDDDGK